MSTKRLWRDEVILYDYKGGLTSGQPGRDALYYHPSQVMKKCYKGPGNCARTSTLPPLAIKVLRVAILCCTMSLRHLEHGDFCAGHPYLNKQITRLLSLNLNLFDCFKNITVHMLGSRDWFNPESPFVTRTNCWWTISVHIWSGHIVMAMEQWIKKESWEERGKESCC